MAHVQSERPNIGAVEAAIIRAELQHDQFHGAASKRPSNPVSQSPELAGGAGFTFEDAVSAEYLIALLGEGYAPGTGDRIVSRVALQQRDFDEPLDDIIVDSRDSKGGRARLSLQVKRSLTISKAKTNTDFRDIIRDSWLTFSKDDFRRSVDRFGAAVGSIAKDKGRALATLGELARESLTVDHFEARFTEAGNANAELVSIRADITDLLNEMSGGSCPASLVHEFLAHFVLMDFVASGSPEQGS